MIREHRKANKHRKFVENVLQGQTGYDAAVNAGYSESTARNIKRNIIDKMDKDLLKSFENVGFTNDYIAKQVMEKTKATNTLVYTDEKQIRKKDGKVDTDTHTRSTVVKEVDDHKSQLTALQLGAKLTGKLVERSQVEVESYQDEDISDMTDEELMQFEKDVLKAKNKIKKLKKTK
jgi:phage terminase small subunit